MEFLDRQTQFKTREVRAQTAVRTAREYHVNLPRPLEVDVEWIFYRHGIYVGSGPNCVDGFAGVDYLTAQVDVLRRVPRARRYRRFVSQQFLHRAP